MNKKTKEIAASLLAVGALFACISMATKPIEKKSSDHDPVVIAENNTLGKTPAQIQSLAKGLDIDVRNSAYLILQEVKNNDDYKWDEGYGSVSYFVLGSIIDPMFVDPAISNMLQDDVDECYKKNGEDSDCWMMYRGISPTWKSQVLDKIFASEKLQNVLYEWINPELVKVVGSFNETKKDYLKRTFDHMISYTASYDHQAEKDFYNACIFVNDPDVFTTGYFVEDDLSIDYNVVINPYRRLETWVYRRVEEKTMTADQINSWLKRLKKDLNV